MNAQDLHRLPFDPSKIFDIQTEMEFNELAILTFHYQYEQNLVYREFCDFLKIDPKKIGDFRAIPFLPISFFKTHHISTQNKKAEVIFKSSGTNGQQRSQHHVLDLALYEQSFMNGFKYFYGDIKDYIILGLLPSYLEQGSSSLVYMVDHLIKASKHVESGFFLKNFDELNVILERTKNKKVLLIGVAYALLDFGETFQTKHPNLTILETGGMKGRRKELIKPDLHRELNHLYPGAIIHSEYGMTELLSQAYSVGLKFRTPPWMKVLTRSYSDPLQLIEGKTGGINIVDLANLHGCSFIATQDLGRINESYFEVVGRFDEADIRGCNLLVQ